MTHQRQPRFFGLGLEVLLAVAKDQTVTQESIASQAHCTARHVRRVLDDLAAAGYISKEGRPNRRLYAVHFEAPLLEPGGPTVGDLVALFGAVR